MIMRFVCILIALLFVSGVVFCQEPILLSYDVSQFPRITVKLMAFDSTGRPTPLSATPAGLRITEDGKERTLDSVSCLPPARQHDISSVLAIDVSGSMSEGNRIEIAREAARAWVDGIESGSDCAITTFDHRHYINSDFSTDSMRLHATIEALKPRGGTNFNEGLLGDPFGALRIAATGSNRRILVFLTDGRGRLKTDSAVAFAQHHNITVFCVSLGSPLPMDLKTLAESTGGMWFENIADAGQAAIAYRKILAIAYMGSSCSVSFNSDTSCSQFRSVRLTLNERTLTFSYQAPENAVASLRLQPRTLTYNVVPIGSTLGRSISISASNVPFTITAIHPPDNPAWKLDAVRLPYIVKAGETLTFRVEYTATDTLYYTSDFRLTTDRCGDYRVFMTAGSMSLPTSKPSISVVYPNGGERLIGGTKTILQWEGIPPDIPVTLDVSLDSGSTWNRAAVNATDYRHEWMVPLEASERCLLRVSQDWSRDRADLLPVAAFEEDSIVGFDVSSNGRILATVSVSLAKPHLLTLYDRNTANAVWKTECDSSAVFLPGSQDILTWSANQVSLLSNARKAVSWARQLRGTGNRQVHPISGQELIVTFAEGNDTVHVLNSKTGTTNGSFVGKGIRDVAGTADGKMLALVGSDANVKIIRPPAMVITDSIKLPQDTKIYQVAFDPTGRILAVAAADGSVTTWNTVDLSRRHSLSMRQYTNDNTYMAFSRDGESIVLETGRDRSVIYSNTTGKELVTLQRPAGEGPASSAGFTPDGDYAFLNTGFHTTFYDPVTGSRLHKYPRFNGAPKFGSQKMEVFVQVSGRRIEVFRIGSAAFQQDLSDQLWAIVKSDPKVRSVRFMPLMVGNVKDTVVVGALVNEGNGDLLVTEIRLEGTQAQDFNVVSTAPILIPAGGTVAVEYGFNPTREGQLATAVVFETIAGQRIGRITGQGLKSDISLNTRDVDFGTVPYGSERSLSPSRFIRNTSAAAIVIESMQLLGPDDSTFSVGFSTPFSLAPREFATVPITFRPYREGRTSTVLAIRYRGAPEPIYATLYGNTQDPLWMTDPTTFRAIGLPTAIIPPVGTITVASYDLAGFSAGASLHENLMVLVGGMLPINNRWFGSDDPSVTWAGSAGIKTGWQLDNDLIVGGGYQMGFSSYNRAATPDDVESEITLHALWATAGYGTDASRFNVYLGYAFKKHVTAFEGSFPADATIAGIGYDYQVGRQWKVCSELFFMRTMPIIPVNITARYFGETYALEAGFVITAITPSAKYAAPAFPVAPLLSFVKKL